MTKHAPSTLPSWIQPPRHGSSPPTALSTRRSATQATAMTAAARNRTQASATPAPAAAGPPAPATLTARKTPPTTPTAGPASGSAPTKTETSTSQMTTPYRYSPSSAAPHETSADLPHPAAHHHPSEGQREHLSTPAPGRPPGPRTPASVPAQDVAGTTHIREAHRPPGFTHRLRTPTVSGHPVSGHPQSPDSLGPGRPCASGRPGRGPSARRFPNLSNHVANGHMVLSRRDK
mmetsp:Transcript_15763/g.38670  ORF Transcript_15763/g.38670 Transcript_15763/m.38670 type:complete len:233 (-) Transcript_15763:645-1343(-)